MENKMLVAETIVEQLGGRMFRIITGSKNFVGTSTGVTFKVGRNRGNISHVKVELDPSDTYTVQFIRVRAGKVKVVSEFNDVYFDTLRSLFTMETGLATSL